MILLAHTSYKCSKSVLHDRRVDELSEKVIILSASFTALSKAVTMALGDANPSGSNPNGSVFIYSKHLPCLERAGYEALAYWDREPWLKIRNGKIVIDVEDSILVLFFEDENGHIVSKPEIRAVRDTARSYFQLLWDKKLAPACWGDAPLELRIDFVRRLEVEYKWLRYCNRHWKSEQIFMNYYPQWYKSRKKKDYKRRERSENQGDENNDENPSGAKRPRVEDIKSTPPVQKVSMGAARGQKRVRSI